MITYKQLFISDVVLIEPQVFNDDRGYFFESFNQKEFEDAIGRQVNFLQDNQSMSSKYVLRGLHYQRKPHEQEKLVRVISGEIFDVAVDIRKNSSTYGCWVGETLSSKNNKQLWIPQGFAHGFLTLSDTAIVSYKTNNYYSPAHEVNLNPLDPSLNIKWRITSNNFILSEKDRLSKNLNEVNI